MKKLVPFLVFTFILSVSSAQVVHVPESPETSSVGESSGGGIAPETYIDSILGGLEGMIVRISTASGGDFRGELLAIGADRVEILDADGQIIAIARKEIISAERELGGLSYFQDAAENRLIVMPTAFGMDRGEFHEANQEIVAFTGSFGLGSHCTLWGGISIPGALMNVKASLPLPGFGGAALGSFVGYAWLGEAWAFLPYAIVTYGTPARHLDAGAGMVKIFTPAVENELYWVITLAGKRPFARTAAVIGESWFILGPETPGEGDLMVTAVPMAVFRIASRRLSWDLGAAFPFVFLSRTARLTGLMEGNFVPLPIISITYRIQ